MKSLLTEVSDEAWARENLCDGELIVLVRDVLTTLSQSVHAGFGADTSHLCTGTLTHLFGERTEVDASLQRHLSAGMRRIETRARDRGWELDLASIRPGRKRAESRMSIRLVAMMTLISWCLRSRRAG